jgi:hypothetical protein
MTCGHAGMSRNCQRRSQQSTNLVGVRWGDSCSSAASLESRPARLPVFPCMPFPGRGCSLLMHLSRRASASDANEDFRSDLELVTASWAAIRRCFRPVLGAQNKTAQTAGAGPTGPARYLAVPASLKLTPALLDALRRVLPRVDAAALFPRLDRG